MFGRTYLISAIIYPRSELQCERCSIYWYTVHDLRANTNYEKNEEKPRLPLKFLHIWQARIISFRQDKKKTTHWFFFFLFVIPTASSKNFASRKKTDSAHLVCVHVIRVKTQKLVGKQGAKLCLSIPLLLWFRKHPRGT